MLFGSYKYIVLERPIFFKVSFYAGIYHLALVCCLCSVLAVSFKWVEEDEVDTDFETEVDDIDTDEFSMDTEEKLALYEDILDELIAASDPARSPKSCNTKGKARKYNLCKSTCKRVKPVRRTCISDCQKTHCPKRG